MLFLWNGNPERSGRGQRVLPGRGVLQTWVISLCSLGPHAFLGSGPRLFLHVGELPFLKQPLHFRGLQQRTVIPSLTLTAMLQCRYHFHPQGTEERSMAQRRGGISSRALTAAGCRMAPRPQGVHGQSPLCEYVCSFTWPKGLYRCD